MVGLEQYFQMVWGSVGHGVVPYLAATFMVVVMMPWVLDILASIAGIKTNLGSKALHFWGKWFIAAPVKFAWHAVVWVMSSLWHLVFRRSHDQHAQHQTHNMRVGTVHVHHHHYYNGNPPPPGPPPGGHP